MIFYIAGLINMIYAFKNYKKAFLWFLIFKLFLVQNITIISIPGIPLLTLDVFITLFFIILFFKNRNKIILERKSFPYKKPYILLVISWTISTIFAYIGFGPAFSAFIGKVSSTIIFPVMMWYLITTKEDFLFLFKWLTIAFFLICLFGFYEQAIRYHPLAEYELTLNNDSSRTIANNLVNLDFDRGWRVQSVFEAPFGAGVNWGIYIILFISLSIKFKIRDIKLKWKYFYIVSVLCFICVILSNSRGPIVFLLIGSLSFVNIKSLKFYVLICFSIILFLIALPYLNEYSDVFLSLFNQKAQSRVGGSNIEMRTDQFNAAFSVMKESPLIGMGYKFQNVYHNIYTSRLLGLESIWLWIITQFGILGIVVNLYYAYYTIIKVPKLYHCLPLFFLSLAFWVDSSMTSTPGICMHLFYLAEICFIKFSISFNKKHILT